MKKRVLPLYSIIASASSFLLLVFWVVLQGMAQKGVLFYIGPNGFTANTLLFVVFLTCALGASAVVVYACLRVKKKLLQIVLIVAVIIGSAVLLLLASIQSLDMPRQYVELISPDGEHCIIVAEDVYPFSVYGGNIYEKNSFCTMKKLTKYEAEIDFYKPFSDGRYEIVWGENSFEISYDFDGKGTYKTVSVEYVK